MALQGCCQARIMGWFSLNPMFENEFLPNFNDGPLVRQQSIESPQSSQHVKRIWHTDSHPVLRGRTSGDDPKLENILRNNCQFMAGVANCFRGNVSNLILRMARFRETQKDVGIGKDQHQS